MRKDVKEFIEDYVPLQARVVAAKKVTVEKLRKEIEELRDNTKEGDAPNKKTVESGVMSLMLLKANEDALGFLNAALVLFGLGGDDEAIDEAIGYANKLLHEIIDEK